MASKNPRINVTFETSTLMLLTKLADNTDKSLAGLVRELSIEALEMREDIYFSKLADELDEESTKTYSHDEAWK